MQLITQKTTPIPAFSHVHGVVSGTPSRALRRRLRTPERLSVSEWAERHRVVTKIDSEYGDWRIDLVPWLKKPMDTVSLPYVRELWLCAPERAGKTQVLMNSAFWGIDQGSKGGSIFWLMPREKDARDAMGDRIIPAMRQKKKNGQKNRLSRYLSDKDDDTKRGMVRFNHGLFLRPAWSNSAAALASYFGYMNIADEVDKFETTSKEGTNPVELFRKRARDDRARTKYIFASTPGAGRYIYSGVMECDQVWQYHARCQHCDELVQQDETHLIFDDGETLDAVKQHGCKIVCPSCGAIWDEYDRQNATYSGGWVCISGNNNPRPETVGFHISGFALPKIKLKELGQKWLETKGGGVSAQSNWAQGYRCIDYEPTKASEDYKKILTLCDDRPRDVVPANTAALILQVDTQQEGFYYELAAVAYGDSGTSHLVNKGYLLTFADLLTFVSRRWHDSEGKEYRIISALIDSGGTRRAGTPPKHSRTKEVYEFCKANPLFIPVKGTGRKDTPVKYTTIDRWPGTNKAIPGGLILVVIDVHYFKDELARRLSVNIDDPGAFVLYSGFAQQDIDQQLDGVPLLNELEDYAKHLCSEYRDELGMWQHDKKAGRNDWADCATYRMYHIELLKQRGQLTVDQQKPVRRKIYSKGVQR